VEDLSLENVKLITRKPDARAAIVLEDASNVLIDGKAEETEKKYMLEQLDSRRDSNPQPSDRQSLPYVL